MDLNTFKEEWNKLMDHKITVYELDKPTQKFVWETLCGYMMTQNVNIEKVSASFDSPQKFQVLLCAHIDKLYKQCNPANEFTVFDLMSPTPNQTFKLLSTLLDGYRRILLAKDELASAFEMQHLQYESVKSSHNKLVMQQEQTKIKNENVEKDIKAAKKKMSLLARQIEELTEKNKHLDVDIVEWTNKSSEQEEQLKRLNDKKERLEGLVVSTEEIERLNNREQALNRELTEILQELKTQKANSVQSQQTINEVQPQLIELNEFLNSLMEYVKDLAQIKKLQVQLEEMKKQLDETKLHVAEKDKKTKLLAQKLMAIGKDYVKLKTSLDEETIRAEDTKQELNSKIEAQLVIQNYQTKTLAELDKEIVSKQELIKHLEESVDILHQHFLQNNYN